MITREPGAGKWRVPVAAQRLSSTQAGANADYAWQLSLRVSGWRKSSAAWLSSLGATTLRRICQSVTTSMSNVRVQGGQGYILAWAWGVVLTCAVLPNVWWNGADGFTANWILSAKLLVGVGTVALAFAMARPLRDSCLVLLVFFLATELRDWLDALPQWRQGFDKRGLFLFCVPLTKMGVALPMMGVLLLLRYQPRDLFLRKGELRAPVAPVLGVRIPMTWEALGTLGTLLCAAVVAGVSKPRPSSADTVAMLSLLPVVLGVAALNALTEQVMFRGALLTPLGRAVGPEQAILLTAALFGVFHYHGIPSGFTGVLLTGCAGWFFSKCMMETRGMFWPWTMQFVSDTLIFYFLAASSK